MKSDKTDLMVSGLSKRYEKGPYIFEDLSHTFKSGTATALIGPNGAGKTTLIKLLSLLSYPTKGQIHLGPLDIHQSPYDYLKEMGMVYDEPDLPGYLNSIELLEWILRQRVKWDECSSDQINDLLDDLNLDERREKIIATYSSGMLKKIQIASALIFDPKLILMDEPLRGLDEESRIAALKLLKDYVEAGGILVMASHNKIILEDLCSEVIKFPLGTN